MNFTSCEDCKHYEVSNAYCKEVLQCKYAFPLREKVDKLSMFEPNEKVIKPEINNNVINPDHYTNCSLECLDIMKIMFGNQKVYDFCVLNAYKYLHRHKHKNNPLEDLEKSLNYIHIAEGIAESDYNIKLFEHISELQIEVVNRYTEIMEGKVE